MSDLKKQRENRVKGKLDYYRSLGNNPSYSSFNKEIDVRKNIPRWVTTLSGSIRLDSSGNATGEIIKFGRVFNVRPLVTGIIQKPNGDVNPLPCGDLATAMTNVRDGAATITDITYSYLVLQYSGSNTYANKNVQYKLRVYDLELLP